MPSLDDPPPPTIEQPAMADLRAAVAWQTGRQGDYLRTGVGLHLDGYPGILARPSFGVRSARRQVTIHVEEPSPWCWSVRARARRYELSRGGQVIARHAGGAELAMHASPQDAAIAILLTVNDVWPGAALWARIVSGVLDASEVVRTSR